MQIDSAEKIELMQIDSAEKNILMFLQLFHFKKQILLMLFSNLGCELCNSD